MTYDNMARYILTDPDGNKWKAHFVRTSYHEGIRIDGPIGEILHPMSQAVWELKGWTVAPVRLPGFYTCKDRQYLFELTNDRTWKYQGVTQKHLEDVIKCYEPLEYISGPYREEIPF